MQVILVRLREDLRPDEGAPGGLPERDAGEVISSRTCLEGSLLHQIGRGHHSGQGQMPWRTASQGRPPHPHDPCRGSLQPGHLAWTSPDAGWLP